MKALFSISAIVVLAILIGCQKESLPTAAGEPNISVQKPGNRNEVADATLLRQQVETKSKLIQEKVEEMNRQNPAGSRSNSFAKVTGVIKVPGDYETIQEAVDAAEDGAIINVTGSFNGNIWVDGKTNLTINGGDGATVTGQQPYYAPFIIRWAENVTIKGFNLVGVVYVYSTQGATIKGNDVSGPNDGIEILGSSRCTIFGNTVHDKMPGPIGTGDGIYLDGSSENVIKGNHIFSNDKYGIGVIAGTRNSLRDNIISNNQGGVYWVATYQNSLRDCRTFSNLYRGIWIIESSENEIKDSEFLRNQFGIMLTGSSDNLIKDVTCNENEMGGIHFYYNCLNNMVANATADNNRTWEGFYLDYETANNTIKDSEARGNGTCDVIDYGTDNIFINNDFGSFNCVL